MDETIQENDTLNNELDDYMSGFNENPNIEEKETPQMPADDRDKTIKTLQAQKEYYRSKYEKERASKPVSVEQKPAVPQNPVDALEIVKLSKAVSELSDDEMAMVMKVAKTSSPKDILDAVNDDFVRAAIAAHREKLETDKKIPEPTNPAADYSPVAPKSVIFNKNVTPDEEKQIDSDIDKATKEAFEKSLRMKGGSGA